MFTNLKVINNEAVNVFLINLPRPRSQVLVDTAEIAQNKLYGGAVLKVQDANSGVFNWIES